VYTYRSIRKIGYTGPVYLVIDNEDDTASEYLARYKDQVVVFDKPLIASMIDDGDNSGDRRAVVYARNACFEIAEQLGITYFWQLDDDYTGFEYRITNRYKYPKGNFMVRGGLDDMLDGLLDYYASIPASSIALAQTGDFIGGKQNKAMLYKAKRKCMNSWICSTDRPFPFVGRMNEDMTTSVRYGGLGHLFLTIPFVAVKQKPTQANSGGMTDLYLDNGTYQKSFYTVMYAPSCTKVGVLSTKHPRLHHQIEWKNAVPCIIGEQYRKDAGERR